MERSLLCVVIVLRERDDVVVFVGISGVNMRDVS